MASSSAAESVSVRCPHHPKNRQVLSFCFNCRVIFCFACRVRPETSHAGHRFELVESAYETCAAQYRVAHATLDEAARAQKEGGAAREADGAALDDRLDQALRLVDSTCDGLHKLVENMRETAQVILFADAGRAHHDADSQMLFLDKPTRKAIENLQNLVRTTENQSELGILKGYKTVKVALQPIRPTKIPGVTSLPVNIQPALKKTVTDMSARFRLAAKNFYRSLRAIKFEKPVADGQLVEVDRLGAETLKTRPDRKEVNVLGIAEATTPNTIYVADTNNSMIKQVDLHARKSREVRYLYLI